MTTQLLKYSKIYSVRFQAPRCSYHTHLWVVSKKKTGIIKTIPDPPIIHSEIPYYGISERFDIFKNIYRNSASTGSVWFWSEVK